MTAYLYLLFGLALMIACGNWLVTGSVQLARHFKISTLPLSKGKITRWESIWLLLVFAIYMIILYR